MVGIQFFIIHISWHCWRYLFGFQINSQVLSLRYHRLYYHRHASQTLAELSETTQHLHFHRTKPPAFSDHSFRLWNTLPHSLRTQTSRKKFHEGVESVFVTPKPSIYYSFGSKLGNIYHTQIRTGSLPLNVHLYQNQKRFSPHCVCKHPSETVQHFLLSCPVYQQIRDDLFTSFH